MSSEIKQKNIQRAKRKMSIRKKISGTPERPRLTIFKSNKYIYIQVIDDLAGNTLVSISNTQKDFHSVKSTVAEAGRLGEALGDRLKAKQIHAVVMDRNGYQFHGVVKAVADGVRNAGIVL